MELVERADHLSILKTKFDNIDEEGHCMLIMGEAGIGKSALINSFCKERQEDYKIFKGACDALFTPRPLAPLYDIMWQLNYQKWPDNNGVVEDRSALFTWFFRELSTQKGKIIVVFEDIHWADEATLDFIKFFARRIPQLKCLFILTFRDNEIHSQHPLKNVLGHLSSSTFTRLSLGPLSKEAVERMASVRGYNGTDVYNITGGNPFYVTEILSSYSTGVPDSIKDSIISVYNRLGEETMRVWDLTSVIPKSLELKYLEKFEPQYANAIDRCLSEGILIIENNYVHFKHELFRRTIETSLSPLKRITLNKKILDMLKEGFEHNNEIERIIHHAKNANEYEIVSHYAPIAALQAISVGAHIEASKQYLTAIEYYQGDDKDVLVKLYEAYAYECFLINQIKESIIYTGKTLAICRENGNNERAGSCLSFLSRLWWLDGNVKKAEAFGLEAIKIADSLPPTKAKAMAYSNMAHLRMLCDQFQESLAWGEKAIETATEINDQETLSHALNNVGCVEMYTKSPKKGLLLLQKSLEIALKNNFHEHAARAYSNMGEISLKIKNYAFAQKIIKEGITYCEERDLDVWLSNILSLNAKLHLEKGNWKEAYTLAESVFQNESWSPAFFTTSSLTTLATIKMRSGSADVHALMTKIEEEFHDSMQLQNTIASLTTLLEYEWLTGNVLIKQPYLDHTINLLERSIDLEKYYEFQYWLLKTKNLRLRPNNDKEIISSTSAALALWAKLGDPYALALQLFEGDHDDKRKALQMINDLGGKAVYNKLKLEMRAAGIKKIPRGIRKTTQANPAFLTNREMEILKSLREGLQNKEIATKLFISSKTVEHHICSILYKLNVKTRIKAVTEAVQQNIIK